MECNFIITCNYLLDYIKCNFNKENIFCIYDVANYKKGKTTNDFITDMIQFNHECVHIFVMNKDTSISLPVPITNTEISTLLSIPITNTEISTKLPISQIPIKILTELDIRNLFKVKMPYGHIIYKNVIYIYTENCCECDDSCVIYLGLELSNWIQNKDKIMIYTNDNYTIPQHGTNAIYDIVCGEIYYFNKGEKYYTDELNNYVLIVRTNANTKNNVNKIYNIEMVRQLVLNCNKLYSDICSIIIEKSNIVKYLVELFENSKSQYDIMPNNIKKTGFGFSIHSLDQIINTTQSIIKNVLEFLESVKFFLCKLKNISLQCKLKKNNILTYSQYKLASQANFSVKKEINKITNLLKDININKYNTTITHINKIMKELNNSSYKQKYLKYKQKYLSFKKNISG